MDGYKGKDNKGWGLRSLESNCVVPYIYIYEARDMFGRGAVWWVHAMASLPPEVPAIYRAWGGELRGQ